MMQAHPQHVQALVIQNANAYREGLGLKWAGIAQYWADPKAHPDALDTFMSFAATEQRHTAGASHPDRYDPDSWTDEYDYLTRPGQREIQGALLYDYQNNVASYPAWQAWLRQHKPLTLVVWGRNDPSFISPGAEAYRRDLPDADIHLLDAGHFAFDEKVDEIAGSMLGFFNRSTFRGRERRLMNSGLRSRGECKCRYFYVCSNWQTRPTAANRPAVRTALTAGCGMFVRSGL
jgi:pimeloyl-ACP methyl ester carboxylesterase